MDVLRPFQELPFAAQHYCMDDHQRAESIKPTKYLNTKTIRKYMYSIYLISPAPENSPAFADAFEKRHFCGIASSLPMAVGTATDIPD